MSVDTNRVLRPIVPKLQKCPADRLQVDVASLMVATSGEIISTLTLNKLVSCSLSSGAGEDERMVVESLFQMTCHLLQA